MQKEDEIRFSGKIGVWFIVSIILDTAGVLFAFIALIKTYSSGSITLLLLFFILVLIFVDIVLIFWATNNYVVFDEKDNITFVYGLKKKRIKARDIKMVRRTKNPTKPGDTLLHRALAVVKIWLLYGEIELFSSAASFDRIEISTQFDRVVFSAKDEHGFFSEITRRAPNARLVQ